MKHLAEPAYKGQDFRTYGTQPPTSTGDDYDFSFGGKGRVFWVYLRVDITVHASGELERRGKNVDVHHLFSHIARLIFRI